MRCRKCNQRAVINMRQHRLALCKEHCIEWISLQSERFIEKYHMFSRSDRILVAVSGGKDSLSLWDVLWRTGYQADGLYIQLGIEELDYSKNSQRLAQTFAEERKLSLQVIDVKEQYRESIPEMAARTRRGEGKPCAVCGLVKRYLMNKTALDHGYDGLVTGHNLDDEAAVLLGNTLHWSVDLLRRQAPVLEAGPGFVRKAKPFCRFYERETAAYALLNGINYISDECPYSAGSPALVYKDLLNSLEEEKPASKLNFYLRFLKISKGLFNPLASGNTFESYSRCSQCGQPTTASGLCSFCRLVEGC